jgi:hypothetical protein
LNSKQGERLNDRHLEIFELLPLAYLRALYELA